MDNGDVKHCNMSDSSNNRFNDSPKVSTTITRPRDPEDIVHLSKFCLLIWSVIRTVPALQGSLKLSVRECTRIAHLSMSKGLLHSCYVAGAGLSTETSCEDMQTPTFTELTFKLQAWIMQKSRPPFYVSEGQCF